MADAREVVRDEKVTETRMDDSVAAQALVTYLEKYLEPSKTARTRQHPRWERNACFLRGRVEAAWNSERKQTVLDEREKVPWVPVMVGLAMNMDITSRMLQVSTECNATPYNPTTGDRTAADIAEAIGNSFIAPELDRTYLECLWWNCSFDRAAWLPAVVKSGAQYVPVPTTDVTPEKIPLIDRFGRLVMNEKGEPQQLVVDGKPQFYAVEGGQRKMREIPKFDLRIDLIPPPQILWDVLKFKGPSRLRNCRFWGYDQRVTKGDIFPICGDTKKLDMLNWSSEQPDEDDFEQLLAKLGGMQVYSTGSEESCILTSLYFAPREFCEDEFLQDKKFPQGLKDGLYIIYEAKSKVILYCGALPVLYKGRIDNVIAVTDQIPTFDGAYGTNLMNATAEIQREVSESLSDDCETRRRGTKRAIICTDVSDEPEMTEISETGDVLVRVRSNGQMAWQPTRVDPIGITIDNFRHTQNMMNYIGVIAGTPNIAPSTRTQTATEILDKKFQAGTRLDLIASQMTKSIESVWRTGLASIGYFFPDQQMMNVCGKFGIWQEIAYRSIDLQNGRYMLRLKPSRWMMGDMSTHWEFVKQMVEMGAITDRSELLKLLRRDITLGNSDEDRWRDVAKSNCQKIVLDPRFTPGVYEMSNVAVMADEVRRFFADHYYDIIDELNEHKTDDASSSIFNRVNTYFHTLRDAVAKEVAMSQIVQQPGMVQQMAAQNQQAAAQRIRDSRAQDIAEAQTAMQAQAQQQNAELQAAKIRMQSQRPSPKAGT